MGFRLFRATGLAFAIRPKDGIAQQGHIQSSALYMIWNTMYDTTLYY